MKTDATFAGAIPPRAETRGSQTPGQRWLADLERAWLDVRPALPERSPAASDVLPPAGRQASPETALVPTGEDAARAHSAGSTPSSTGRPADSGDHARSAVNSRGGGLDAALMAFPDGGLPPTPVPAGFDPGLVARSTGAPPPLVDAALSSDATMGEQAMSTEAPRPSESLSPSTGGRVAHASLDPAQGGEEVTAKPGPDRSVETPAYGRRLLQVSGGDELQINLRDAALTPPQQEAVAHALFAQVGSTGAALRRLYLNGQRYEPRVEAIRTSDATAGSAARAVPSADPHQPTSILNDKE